MAILACCLVHVVSLPLVRASFSRSTLQSQFLQHPDASNFLDARLLDFHQSTPRSVVQGVVDAIGKQNKSPSSPSPTPGGVYSGVIKGVADAVDKQNQPPASTPSDGSKKSSGIVGGVVHGFKEAIDKQNQPPTDGDDKKKASDTPAGGEKKTASENKSSTPSDGTKKSSGITDGVVRGVKEAIDKQSQPPTPRG